MPAGLITGLTAVAVPALKLIAGAVEKKHDADGVNQYVDRSNVFKLLFSKDAGEAQDAHNKLYGDIVTTLARKGITASPWWLDVDETGREHSAPCLRIPISTIRELLDAASK